MLLHIYLLNKAANPSNVSEQDMLNLNIMQICIIIGHSLCHAAGALFQVPVDLCINRIGT